MITNRSSSASRGSAANGHTKADMSQVMAGATRLLALSVSRPQSTSSSLGSVAGTGARALSDAGSAKLSPSEADALGKMDTKVVLALLERGLTVKQIVQIQALPGQQIGILFSDKTVIRAFMAAGMKVSDAVDLGVWKIVSPENISAEFIKKLKDHLSRGTPAREAVLYAAATLGDALNPGFYDDLKEAGTKGRTTVDQAFHYARAMSVARKLDFTPPDALLAMDPGDINSLSSFIRGVYKNNEGAINLLKYLGVSGYPVEFLTKFSKLDESQKNNSLLAFTQYVSADAPLRHGLSPDELCNPEFISLLLSTPVRDTSPAGIEAKLYSARAQYLTQRLDGKISDEDLKLILPEALRNLVSTNPELIKSLLSRGCLLYEIGDISAGDMKRVLDLDPTLFEWLRSEVGLRLGQLANLSWSDISLLSQAKSEGYVLDIEGEHDLHSLGIRTVLGPVSAFSGMYLVTTLSGNKKLLVSKTQSELNHITVVMYLKERGRLA